jgi:acetylornithine deacetylase
MTTVVEHLSNLIRIPSPSFLSNRPIIDYAKDVLQQAEWTSKEIVYRDAAGIEKVNLIAAPPKQDPEDPMVELALMCHTDTVPYSPDWPDALEPFIKDGQLHGCGACDVKGFLACCLTVLTRRNPRGFVVYGLRLILTADEEIGCIGAAHLVASERIRPKKLIVGEPTSLRPARAGKGYCLAEITVFGEEAHSAHPQKGKSAIYRAARLITALEDYSSVLAEELHPLFSPGFTTLNIGTIDGGTAKNIVPGRCKFLLEWRPIPGQPMNSVPQALSEIADSLRRRDQDFQCHLQILRQQEGFESSANSSLVRTVEASVGRAATSIPFGSEASIMASIATDIIVFGPGDMQTAHSSRECVPVAELDESVDCLHSLMVECA